MKNLLEKLCNSCGVSGYEMESAKVAKELLKPYVDDVKIDKMGNVIGYKYSKKENAKTIMLDAHIDQIGFIVTDITKDGFLKFTNVGGVDPRMLLGTDVLVHGTETIRGIVCCMPPHLSTNDNKAPKIQDMIIDIGFTKEQASKQVEIGTNITFAEEIYSISSETITGKALDDRAGVASIIHAMELLQNENLDVNVVVCFSVCEEVFGTGAMTATFELEPDFAIAVDVTHAKTPDAPANKTFEMGKIYIGIGPNLQKQMGKDLIRTCKAYDIPYGLEIMEGDTGTNAWYIQVSRKGVPVSLISIALKYMHTPIETVKISDIKNTSKLIEEYLKNYKEAKND